MTARDLIIGGILFYLWSQRSQVTPAPADVPFPVIPALPLAPMPPAASAIPVLPGMSAAAITQQAAQLDDRALNTGHWKYKHVLSNGAVAYNDLTPAAYQASLPAGLIVLVSTTTGY